MQILAIEHHDAPSVGVVGETLEAQGVETRVLWGAHGDCMPERPDGYHGLVVLGGAMNALDDERCPCFPALLSLIREFTQLDKPVLGICLGAQLIARAFDGQAQLDGPFEFGFHPIKLTDDGIVDPVIAHMAEQLNLFQWHTDHYDLPCDAVKLATGSDYPNQAYRIGRATYGMQFHFEVTQAIVEGWISHYADMNDQAPDYATWLPKQFDQHMEASKQFCRDLVRRWLMLCEG